MRKLMTMLAGAALCTFVMALPAAAQQTETKVKPQAPTQNQNQDQERELQKKENLFKAGNEEGSQSAAAGISIRASQVIGMHVINNDGKQLGSVADIVLDMRSGRVRYAALSFGGFLGVGDKLFAVPWRALQVRQNAETGDNMLVLNVSEEKLEKAPGFDQEHWPNFGDRAFTTGVDSYYGVDREDLRERGEQLRENLRERANDVRDKIEKRLDETGKAIEKSTDDAADSIKKALDD